ncbi:transmembrane protein 165 [Octopus bimaculoides]|uniref:GDT1 family protein n=1 Tax=Octopus bimaculoides TaxID=37653 RepID=A0A0L8GQQ1_OCTBM|nr:transmembrane protein 165 [Octopus bimaculoides]|eukprot:XP_014778971.1 PREDICTED: transmembrane protein 165-like [Octopus bimaculoides]
MTVSWVLRWCLISTFGLSLLVAISNAESIPLEPGIKNDAGPLGSNKHKLGVSHTVDKTGPYGTQKETEAIGSTNLGFIHAFIASLSVIIVSELGDKTFFIAAIMAMRHSRVTVFLGAMAALALMTVLSAILGFATTIIPRKYTFYISSLLFAIFGLKMLKDGYEMSADDGQEEYEEVQADLKKREDEMQKASYSQDVETGIIRTPGRRWLTGLISTIFLQALTLTFLAEWGDRSQVTTIILAAREDIYGVIIGGVLGHSLCTGLAVVGGRIIAQRISTRTVTLVGGVVFIMFALSALVIGPE